ncbi:MAG TPA: EutN/CcmL family microcompartment protein [Elusimicrobiota bacterium]|nr:EutN/CcmL family microcompartment protein [Elusimicrobiota bacterium]
MFIGKVIGNVWATQRHPEMGTAKLLLVQPMDGITRKAWGDPLLALDAKMGAGIGDVVLVMDEGSSARQILKNTKAPIRTIVCGVVDSVTASGKTVRYH